MPAHFKTLAELQKKLASGEPKPGVTYTLDRMQAAVAALQHPEQQYRVVHVGGTSGKGSTCVMITSILQTGGYSVGTYTSPAFVTPLNGIVVNGKAITEKQAMRILNKHWDLIQQHQLTQFETFALLAFAWFAEQHVDFAVIEVGVGGRLDATNVVRPTVAIVTTVGLDHKELLGNTLPEIAAEKAAIIKPGCIGLTGYPLLKAGQYIDTSKAKLIHTGIDGTTFSYKSHKELKLKMLGAYQVHNAVLAIEAAQALHISSLAIRLGLTKAKQKGRFQVLSKRPLVIADGAHNPQKMQAFVQSLKAMQVLKRKRVVGLCSIKATKEMLPTFKPLFTQLDVLFLTTFPGSATLTAMQRAAKQLNPKLKIVVVPQATAAYSKFKRTLNSDDVGIITGSLYLIGKLQRVL